MDRQESNKPGQRILKTPLIATSAKAGTVLHNALIAQKPDAPIRLVASPHVKISQISGLPGSIRPLRPVSYTASPTTSQAQTAAPPPAKTNPNGNKIMHEMHVRVPNRKDKRFSVLRFHESDKLEFPSTPGAPPCEVFMQRENNLKHFKGAFNIQDTPTKGAGSEYGREAKMEARLKKLGVSLHTYKPEDQPWLMTVGKGRTAKRYRGARERAVTNAQYFIFCQCKDGNFDAYPVHEWYKMNPEINYRYLKEEEAEAEYTRLNKTMNLFNVMVQKKISEADADDEGPNEGSRSKREGGAPSALRKNRKSFKLTDLDELAGSEDNEDEEDAEDARADEEKTGDKDDTERKQSSAARERQRKMDRAKKLLSRKRTNIKQRRRKTRKGRRDAYDSEDDNDMGFLDDEVEDESDPDDHLGDEVDYMTNSSSDEDKMSDEDREKLYEEPGVDEEAGLKALLTDVSSDEEVNEDKDDGSGKSGAKKDAAEGSQNEGSAEESGDDRARSSKKSKTKKSGKTADSSSDSSDGGTSSSVSSSCSSDSSDSEPDFDKNTKKAELLQVISRHTAAVAVAASMGKRPGDSAAGDAEDTAKRPRIDGDASSQSASSPSAGVTGESELMQAVRKYLQRKPFTVAELLRKIRAKHLVAPNENAQVKLAEALKQLRPHTDMINGQPLLSLK